MIRIQYFRCKYVKKRSTDLTTTFQRFKSVGPVRFTEVEDAVKVGRWLESTFRQGETLQWKLC